jgi:hypothetical protein
MAVKNQSARVTLYIETGEAQKNYDKLIAKQKEFEKELATATNTKRIKVLKDEIAKLAEPISRAAKKLSGELAPGYREVEKAARSAFNAWSLTGDPKMLAQYQKFNGVLREMKLEANGMEKAQEGLSKRGIFSAAFWAMLAGGLVNRAMSAVSNFFSGTIEEALEAEEATSRLEGTLSNLGRTDAFDRLARKAQMLADRFRYLDNDEVIAVFNKLIDYGKLTERQMDELLPIIIDFAAKSRISIEQSSSVIIKALEGNGKALKEYGIDIKDAKTDSERFSVVTQTLADKVKGAGEAFQNSARGGMATARQELNNLKEDIGNLVIPVLNRLLNFVVGAAKGLKQLAIDIRNVFSPPSLKGQAEEEKNIRRRNEEEDHVKFMASLESKSEKDRDAAIKKRIADTEYLISAEAKNREAAEGNEVELQAIAYSLAGLERRLSLIKGELSSNTILGIDPGDGPVKADTSAADKLKKAQEAYADFFKKLKSLNEDFDISQLEGFEKDLALVVKKTENLKTESDEHVKHITDTAEREKKKSELLLQIDELYRKELLALVDKYEKLDKEKFDKAAKEKAEAIAKAYKLLGEKLAAGAAILSEDRLAGNELAVLESRGRARLEARKRQLAEEEKLEIAAAIKKAKDAGVSEEKIQNTLKLIRRKFRDQEKEEETQFFTSLVSKFQEYGSMVLTEISFFANLQTEKENAELERDRSLNDEKKANLDKRLKQGLISQSQYNREVDRLDRELLKKEKKLHIEQFERQKKINAANAFISGQGAVLKTAEIFGAPIPPNIPGIIAFALMEALVIAKTAAILNQKPPALHARGGKLGGRSHSEGGNPILDGQGRKIAEIERGEGIINKHSMSDRSQYTVSGTPSQIASVINSMGGNGISWDPGGRLLPAWYTRRPAAFNFGAINRYYATGGTFGSSGSEASGSSVDLQMHQLMVRLTGTLEQVNNQLKLPLIAYTSLRDHETQQERLDAIRADATMKG